MGAKKPAHDLSAEELAEGAEVADWLADDYTAQGFPRLAAAYRAKGERRRRLAEEKR